MIDISSGGLGKFSELIFNKKSIVDELIIKRTLDRSRPLLMKFSSRLNSLIRIDRKIRRNSNNAGKILSSKDIADANYYLFKFRFFLLFSGIVEYEPGRVKTSMIRYRMSVMICCIALSCRAFGSFRKSDVAKESRGARTRLK